jgi:hypothetical protein
VLVLVFICIVGSYLVRLEASGDPARINRSEGLLEGSERWGGAGLHIWILRSTVDCSDKRRLPAMSGYRTASS